MSLNHSLFVSHPVLVPHLLFSLKFRYELSNRVEEYSIEYYLIR